MRLAIGIADNPYNDTYRLVHGEGDHLPGLIIDCYGQTAVMQAHSVGMHVCRHEITKALLDVMGSRIQNVYYKSETTLPFKADLGQENGFIYGGTDNNICIENGLKFHVDWLKGQKTGFFVDQRDNRSLVEVCSWTLRAQYVLLYGWFLRICHAWRGPTGTLGRLFCQSH